MLVSLHIRDFALIDEATLEFQPGFNVLTGETGAGKSLILQALAVVTGQRARSEWIRSGENQAQVTAVFDLTEQPQALGQLQAHDIPIADGELLLQRTITAQGKSRVRINGLPGTASLLQQVTEGLIDIVSQQDQQVLLRHEWQQAMLDQFGELAVLQANYQEQWQQVQRITQELKQWEARQQSLREQEDYLRFQLKELQAAKLVENEFEQLKQQKIQLKHGVKIAAACEDAEQLLTTGESPVLDQIARLLERVEFLQTIDEAFAEDVQQLQATITTLEDLSHRLVQYGAQQSDEQDFDRLEDRLVLLEDLQRKYRATIPELLEKMTSLDQQLNDLEFHDERLRELEQRRDVAAQDLQIAAQALTKARRQAGKKLTQALLKELKDLDLPHSQFAVELVDWKVGQGLELAKKVYHRSGAEQVHFVFSANPGQPLLPLVKVASGGEQSRLLLGLKKIMVEWSALGTSIYDEVDEGLSGPTAARIGRKLAHMGQFRQVIAISHQAQVAAAARHHFLIEKSTDGQSSHTAVVPLNAEERLEEITRMLAGQEITAQARAHAQDLLAQGQ